MLAQIPQIKVQIEVYEDYPDLEEEIHSFESNRKVDAIDSEHRKSTELRDCTEGLKCLNDIFRHFWYTY